MKAKIQKINPSNNIIPEILYNQFHYRKYNEFIGKSEIVIAKMEEPVWWNRPLKKDTDSLLKQEADGLYSFNLPIAWVDKQWKSAYNVILNTNNAPIALHLCFKNKIDDALKADLRLATGKAIYNTLVEIGVPEDEIIYFNNDVLIHGKKFAGGEAITKENIYEENIFLTLNYIAEKEIFDRLTVGKVTPKRQITGIFDEIKIKVSKDKFLNIYKQNIEEFINQILEKHKATNELINL